MSQLDDVFARITRALWPGAVWYMFKLGEVAEVRGGRLFTDFTESRLRQAVARHSPLSVVRAWLTKDLRAPQGGQTWVNALARKCGRARE
jgi:hypothetical protein